MEANASFPALKLFVEKLDEYGDLMKKVIDGVAIHWYNGAMLQFHRTTRQTSRDPLELMIRMGDYKFPRQILGVRNASTWCGW